MRKHLSALVAILLGISTSFLVGGCTTPKQDIGLRLPPEPDFSKLKRDSLMSCFNFSSREELKEALHNWNNGVITNGYWNGLNLRKYSWDDNSGLDSLLEEKSESVSNFIQALKSRYPNFDELHAIKKAQIIYTACRRDFKYRINPFNKLKIGKNKLGVEESDKQIEGIRAGIKQPFQTPEQTFVFNGGICGDLSILLAKFYKEVGIESCRVYISRIDGPSHMITAFEVKPGVYLPIDLTKRHYPFVFNLTETRKYLQEREVKKIVLSKEGVSLNLTDYL